PSRRAGRRGVPPRLRRPLRGVSERRRDPRPAPLPARAREAALTVEALLELHEPRGALAMLDAYLADEGFWGRRGVVADLFLGYRLSEPLRRTRVPAPPEPCRL